ncbi:MAG: hypothetical protein A3F11_04680 [Gammaproteobacteria bacterium RIFCSPHIGHO2_12_FULL_37_14]|nr:MAG: hypothetical protein A3F11_04680 [Gammaproteobacteria bacterium RIFCSPHIGHO2_12_FULL_37_14]
MVFNRIFFTMMMLMMLVGCAATEEVWTGRNQNPIQVVCGQSCKTIYFRNNSAYLSPEQRYRINEFVYQSKRHQPIFISLCNTNPPNLALNSYRLRLIIRQVKNLGFTPVTLKPTLPEDLSSKNCANLVRGKLKLYVQKCPNNTITPSVHNVGSDFGCTTNYNLAQMIINPWNLLARPGDNGTEGDRVAIGIKNYRTAKPVDLNTVGSDSGSSASDLAQ